MVETNSTEFAFDHST